jgi:hypothetical protein
MEPQLWAGNPLAVPTVVPQRPISATFPPAGILSNDSSCWTHLAGKIYLNEGNHLADRILEILQKEMSVWTSDTCSVRRSFGSPNLHLTVPSSS